MDKWFEYSIWSEKAGNERRYFWIVDEVQENGEDRAVDMWFRADNCFIHTQRECEIYQEWHRPNDARERNEAHQE